jgi:hypothetical protein
MAAALEVALEVESAMVAIEYMSRDKCCWYG